MTNRRQTSLRHALPVNALALFAVCALVATALAACGGSASDDTATNDTATSPTVTTTAPLAADALSIVQLGDSIASGEGTLYGYHYDTDTRRWRGGNIDARWPGPYPDCHVSPDAYGNVVATALDARLTTFACSGATFAEGVTAPETDDGTTMRPAQFGNWEQRSDLNRDYDRAKPDLVLITLGADDVQFVEIVTSCVRNSYEVYFHVAERECTKDRPGDTIERDFWDFLPTLEANYRTLAGWIRERGGEDPPKVIFTSYANPLPADGSKCPDTSFLYPDQVEYLASLVDEMNSRIGSVIGDIAASDPNVAFVDLASTYEADGGHRWCSDDPWAYGLSIFRFMHPSSFRSQAPFHPTPRGQAAIAALVEPIARELVG